jgi:hypothetical protein
VLLRETEFLSNANQAKSAVKKFGFSTVHLVPSFLVNWPGETPFMRTGRFPFPRLSPNDAPRSTLW